MQERKQIRIENYDYAAAGAYFVTICTANKEKLFWDNVGADIIRPQEMLLSPIGKMVKESILQIPAHYENVFVDKYCVMPNHLHMILRIESNVNGRIISAPTISTVVGSMKRWASRKIGKPIWQKSFYDHAIRNQYDYDEIWQYIDSNPAKWIGDGFRSVGE